MVVTFRERSSVPSFRSSERSRHARRYPRTLFPPCSFFRPVWFPPVGRAAISWRGTGVPGLLLYSTRKRSSTSGGHRRRRRQRLTGRSTRPPVPSAIDRPHRLRIVHLLGQPVNQETVERKKKNNKTSPLILFRFRSRGSSSFAARVAHRRAGARVCPRASTCVREVTTLVLDDRSLTFFRRQSP